MRCPRIRSCSRWWWRWLGVILLSAGPAPAVRAQEASSTSGAASGPPRFHLLFSSRMFTDVHESDAKAALIAWAETLTRQRQIRAEPDPQVVDGLPALARAWGTGQCDLITLTTDEYLSLGMDADQDSLIVGVAGGRFMVEYLLLVHRDSDVHDLAGLKGRTVLLHESPRTYLAPPWLDTILLEKGLSPATRHFARVSQVKKLSGAVLPVFFRQADACVVPRDGLETLSELNPQVGSQLLILACSPKLLPSLSCVRTRTDGSLGINLLWEVKRLHSTPSGKQILNLFQVDSLTAVPASATDGARDLLALRRRLMAQWEAGGSKTAPAKAALGGAQRPGSSAGAVGDRGL